MKNGAERGTLSPCPVPPRSQKRGTRGSGTGQVSRFPCPDAHPSLKIKKARTHLPILLSFKQLQIKNRKRMSCKSDSRVKWICQFFSNRLIPVSISINPSQKIRSFVLLKCTKNSPRIRFFHQKSILIQLICKISLKKKIEKISVETDICIR